MIIGIKLNACNVITYLEFYKKMQINFSIALFVELFQQAVAFLELKRKLINDI